MNPPGRLFDLAGRVTLVVGGGYLGRWICHHLIALGAAVLVAGHNLEAAESVRDEIAMDTRDATVRAAAGLMFERGGGSIVNFVTMYASVSPDPRAYPANSSVNPPDYGAAKAGLMPLTRYQAVMWAPRGVRGNAIAPGPFPNPKVQGEQPEMVRRLSERTPMGRIGQPDEILGAVIYLASAASTCVTGSTLMVDGGWTAW